MCAGKLVSISQDVAIITSWGGYYDIKDWILAVITEQCTYQGEIKPWKPNIALAEEVFQWLVELLPSSSDRVYIEEMLGGNSVGLVKDNLSPSGQAMYELLTNRDYKRARALWTRLDSKTQQTLANLSPSTSIAQLQTKVVIIHGFADPYIPSVESRKLADAIEDKNKDYFRIFYQFSHVDPNELFKVRLSNLHNIIFESIEFYRYIYHILYRL